MSNHSPTPWDITPRAGIREEGFYLFSSANTLVAEFDGPNAEKDVKHTKACVNALAGIVTEEYTADMFVKEVIRLVGYTEVENGNPKPEYFEVKRRLRAALARKEAAK